jgi:hypothetical protein
MGAIQFNNYVRMLESSIPDSQSIPSKRVVKKVISTIENAISISAGATSHNIFLGLDGTESEVWIGVAMSLQPWTLYANNVFNVSAFDSNGVYPTRIAHVYTYGTIKPAMSLVLGVAPGSQGMAAPASYVEAKNASIPLDSSTAVNVQNGHATDTATLTVKVTRIWR